MSKSQRNPSRSSRLRRVALRIRATPAGRAVSRFRDAISRLRLEREPWVTSVGGFQMLVDPHDDRAVALVVAGGSIDRVLTELWIDLYEMLNPRTVIDVGANYGEVLLSTGYTPSTNVVAVEANPAVAACLRESLSANQLPEVVVHEVAVGDETGSKLLYVHSTWSGKTSIVDHGEPHHSLKVPVRRLDNLVQAAPTEDLLMKIDVEGAEMQVLRGAEGLIAHAGTAVVVAEITHTDVDDLLGWVSKMRAHCFLLNRRLRSFVPADAQNLTTAKGNVANHPFLRDVLILSGPDASGEFLRRMPPPYSFVDSADGSF